MNVPFVASFIDTKQILGPICNNFCQMLSDVPVKIWQEHCKVSNLILIKVLDFSLVHYEIFSLTVGIKLNQLLSVSSNFMIPWKEELQESIFRFTVGILDTVQAIRNITLIS